MFVRPGCKRDFGSFPCLRRPILANLLLRRLKYAGRDEVPHLYTIDRIAQVVQDLSQGPIHAPESDLTEALFAAAESYLGYHAAKLTVLESGTCDQPCGESINVLAAAAFLGSRDAVATMLCKGVDINASSVYFGFPLRLAAGRGHFDVVLFLLEHGANVNGIGGSNRFAFHPCDGCSDTALQTASRRGDESMVRLLLKPKYGLETKGKYYDSALWQAAHFGHTDLVHFLLQNYTSANRTRIHSEILLVASESGNLQLVKAMLDQGVDVNYVGITGDRALDNAAGEGHLFIVSFLLGKGAVFQWACPGKDAINAAASHEHEDVVRFLLDHGADVNSLIGAPNKTPLYEAAMSQDVSIMRLLLDRGADINVFECGENAFSDAVRLGYEGVIPVLVGAGVDINSTGYEGEPAPILSAMMYGQSRIVELLLELGAKPVDPLASAWAEDFRNGTYPQDFRRLSPRLLPG